MKYIKEYEQNFNFDLIYSVKHNDLVSVEQLIKQGVNINIQDRDDSTALMWAAHNFNIEMVELLIKAGADLDIQNNEGYTALMKKNSSPQSGERWFISCSNFMIDFMKSLFKDFLVFKYLYIN